MTKRSTIGANPFDEVIPNPLEATISDQSGLRESSTDQDRKKQGKSVSAGEHHASASVLHTKEDATQNPPAPLVGGPKGKPGIHQEDVAQPSQPEIEVLPPSSKLAERVSELEEENLCLKWALGLILAPLALLALLG